jgi:dipeptidyl aminopeptidase/acylaminoacyl peptidase
MFFSARKMSESRTTVYSASTTKPGDAKAIYTDELPGFLTDVDAKGATALFVQSQDVHGDDVGPRTESDLIVKALREKGVPSEYMVAANEGHSLARKETQVEFYARCARFLETHLK